MPIENRIRWSGLLIVLGVTILLFTLRWSHPLSFMAFLVFGCPLILAGILLFLWALAMKDGPRGTSALLIVCVLLLPLVASACGGSDIPVPSGKPQTFDPSTATARVFGTVSLEGEKPDLGSVKMGRQDSFCLANSKNIFKRGALFTEDGTLRNVIVYVRSGLEGRTYPVPSEPVVLDQQECVYLPHALTLMKGQQLKILNSDPTFHNVHAQAEGKTEFNIPQPTKGTVSIQTFSRAAMPPFRIGCDFHNWMAAYVGVFEHPFHMATGDTGKFELKLPPGKYEIAAWHEKFGEMMATAELASNASLELNFEFHTAGRK